MSPVSTRRRASVAARRRVTVFDPLSLSPAVWWKADAGTSTTTDGVAISQWDDQSGNARHLVQATGTKQPLYKAAIQNGLPVVRLDGTDDFMNYVSGSSWITTTEITAFSVCSCASWGGGGIMGVVGSSFGDFNSTTGFLLGYAGGTTFRNSGTVGTVTPATGSFFVETTRFDGTNNTAYKDGAAGSTVASTGSFSVRKVFLGRSADGTTASNPIAVDYGELLMFPSALSAGNRQAVEVYLKARWGTP